MLRCAAGFIGSSLIAFFNVFMAAFCLPLLINRLERGLKAQPGRTTREFMLDGIGGSTDIVAHWAFARTGDRHGREPLERGGLCGNSIGQIDLEL